VVLDNIRDAYEVLKCLIDVLMSSKLHGGKWLSGISHIEITRSCLQGKLEQVDTCLYTASVHCNVSVGTARKHEFLMPAREASNGNYCKPHCGLGDEALSVCLVQSV
jgi:hypothetical protein